MTKREVITAMLNDTNVNTNSDYVAYLKNELELVIKKNTYKSSKPTKTQIENEALKDRILDLLRTQPEPMTATNIANALDISVNKASAMLKQLKEDNSVVKEVVKRKSYFTIA